MSRLMRAGFWCNTIRRVCHNTCTASILLVLIMQVFLFFLYNPTVLNSEADCSGAKQ